MSFKTVDTFKRAPYTFTSEMVSCGKKNCVKCQKKIGHGPYWFKSWTAKGVKYKKYIGKKLKDDSVTAGITEVL